MQRISLETAEMILRRQMHEAPGQIGAVLGAKLAGVGLVSWVGVAPPMEPGAVNTVSYWTERATFLLGYGIVGDRQAGVRRVASLSDEFAVHLAGLEVRQSHLFNLHQVTIMSQERSAHIARAMGLPDDHVPRGLQSENIVVEGLDFDDLKPGTTLVFFDGKGFVSSLMLYVTGALSPCETPEEMIEVHYAREKFPILKPYTEAAKGQEGLTAVVLASNPHGTVLSEGWFVAAFAGGV